jgi:hypothetical protein
VQWKTAALTNIEKRKENPSEQIKDQGGEGEILPAEERGTDKRRYSCHVTRILKLCQPC